MAKVSENFKCFFSSRLSVKKSLKIFPTNTNLFFRKHFPNISEIAPKCFETSFQVKPIKWYIPLNIQFCYPAAPLKMSNTTHIQNLCEENFKLAKPCKQDMWRCNKIFKISQILNFPFYLTQKACKAPTGAHLCRRRWKVWQIQ